MRQSRSVAVIATFTALIVGTDLVLSGPEFSNIKLLDTLVFVSAYVFGFRIGAAVGVLSETVWSVISPIGMAGAIAPFLIAGELLFASAGWAASRVWRKGDGEVWKYSLFFGALMALCAFVWDLETNFATALIQYGPSLPLPQVLFTMFGPPALIFALAHEGSDFAFGCLVAPGFVQLIPRVMRRNL